MSSFSERFIRAQNVQHYQDLLARTADEGGRRRIQALLDEEQRKQIDAGDFDLQRTR